MPPTDPTAAAPTRPIRFVHRGRVVDVSGVSPTRTVLDWLREDAHRTGTKEGCNEGDCGACTVVVGEPAEADDPTAVRGLSLKTVNACIRFLPTLDGKALFTVEDLKGIAAESARTESPAANGGQAAADGTVSAPADGPASHRHGKPTIPLHPVQQALVDCHGSQCGFCTPGFVMSLWSTYERCGEHGERPTRQQLADELSGNLCRCTGYRPILDAGQRMFDLPTVALDTAPVLAALATIKPRTDAFVYEGPAAPIATLPAAPAAVPSIASGGDASNAATAEPPLAAARSAARFHAPTTIDALAALRIAHPDARLLAGSTDVGLWVTKQFRPLDEILYVGQVDALKRIEADATTLTIGAGASLEAAFAALAARAPTLVDAWLRFASPPIRNAGTLGGNVANGSPIGDSPPILMALDAELVLRRGERTRRLPLDVFYVDYMKNRLEPGEFLEAIAVPLAAFDRPLRAYKISKRFDSDISAVFAGFAIAFEDGDDSASPRGATSPTGARTVGTVRLAFGGMAATAKRAQRAEAAILGQPWNETTVKAAQAALAIDFTPLSDMRASAAYRLQVAQNLVKRFWLETRADDPLPAAATSVYSVMPHRELIATSGAAR